MRDRRSAPSGRRIRYHAGGMSEHTERIEDLTARLSSAKEYL